MSEIEGEPTRFRYRQSVREHAREPLRRARDRLERERAEVRAERTAFEQFAARVATIRPPATVDGPLVLGGDGGAERRDAVRDAYRETVLALDHYDDVYDEPLLVNLASELSTDIAEGLRSDAGVPFSEQFRDVIRAAAADAAARRGTFIESLDDERDSLDHARETVDEAIGVLDGSGLPPGRRPWFEERLEELVGRRQRRLQARAGYRQDGHDLCEYVYGETEWTYPVLTAVARLRNSVA